MMTIRLAFLALLSVFFALPASSQTVAARQVRLDAGTNLQEEIDAGTLAGGAMESASGDVRPRTAGEGLVVRDSLGATVATIDPDTGSMSCSGGAGTLGCAFTAAAPLTEGGEFCLFGPGGAVLWCLKMDATATAGTCTRTGSGWTGDCPDSVGPVERFGGFVRPTTLGEGLKVRNASGDVVATIDPETGSYSCTGGEGTAGCGLASTPPVATGEPICASEGSSFGIDQFCFVVADEDVPPGECVWTSTGWTGADCPGAGANVYSAAAAFMFGINLTSGAAVPIVAALGSAVGSDVVIDAGSNEVDLISPGTYRLTLKVLAGFTVSTNECMRFIVYDKTHATAIDTQASALSGSLDRGTSSVYRAGNVDGLALYTITEPTSIEVQAQTCTGAAFPATNNVDPNASSVWVERVK